MDYSKKLFKKHENMIHYKIILSERIWNGVSLPNMVIYYYNGLNGLTQYYEQLKTKICHS